MFYTFIVIIFLNNDIPATFLTSYSEAEYFNENFNSKMYQNRISNE